MLRILVLGMSGNPGGIEAFITNYYRNINKDNFKFDFLCNTPKIAYEDELLRMGARIFHIVARSKNPFRFYKELEYIFKNHSKEWDVIWVNKCTLSNVEYLKVAKKYGIKKRVIHSHNSENMDSFLNGLLHKYNKMQIGDYATDFWACSYDAAKFFYNENILKQVVIIKNAIDVKKFTFDKEGRENIRKHNGWRNKYIIGNVGRLHFQKNQSFMLDVFKSFLSKEPQSILVLVGQGEDEKMLREKSKRLGIEEKVYFAGVQNNIKDWLSAFDLFLFPSNFEGLGIAALEAQANGLPVLVSSDVIPTEVRINDNLDFLSLGKGADEWARKIVEIKKSKTRLPFDEIYKAFVEKGYEISTEIDKVEKLLLE